MKKPEFVLTDRLPAEAVAPRLLGRIVADILHPTYYYRPEDPRTSLANERLEIVDSNFSSLLSSVKSKNIRVKLGDILGVDLSNESSSSHSMQGKTVKTETLAQHPDALESLLKDHRQPIQELLAKNKNKGYMIVGIKTCLDPQMEITSDSQTQISGNADIPAAAAIDAASHGTLQAPDSMNVSLEGNWVRTGTARLNYQGVGEQVFAIQYRIVTLEKPMPWSKKKEPTIDAKELKTVAFDDGVFSSAKKQEQKADTGNGKGASGAIIELGDSDATSEAAKRGIEIFCLPVESDDTEQPEQLQGVRPEGVEVSSVAEGIVRAELSSSQARNENAGSEVAEQPEQLQRAGTDSAGGSEAVEERVRDELSPSQAQSGNADSVGKEEDVKSLSKEMKKMNMEYKVRSSEELAAEAGATSAT